MKRTRDQMLDHEYDGIREYDNPPPNWIMFILYGSVVFAVTYWLAFHTYHIGHLPVQKYEGEMAHVAEMQLAKMGNQDVSDASLALMSTIPSRVAEGRQVFEQFCVVCHAPGGTGNVGPNLTDSYWLHGGKPTQILHTVTKGVPEKGMVAWGDQLGPARIQKVVAYVLTLKGRNLPGKAPQGILETQDAGAPAGPAGAATPAGVATPAGATTPASAAAPAGGGTPAPSGGAGTAQPAGGGTSTRPAAGAGEPR